MSRPKKRKRSSVLDATSPPTQTREELSGADNPPPSLQCHPLSRLPGQVPLVPISHPLAEPQYYISTTNTLAASPVKYERILPKRPSEAFSVNPPSGSRQPFLQPYQSFTVSQASQREKARKVSHSAIERRRRERINDKIMQLKNIIPTCADQVNLHKLSILQSAIDYIQYLKTLVDSTAPQYQNIDPSPPCSDSLVTDHVSLTKNTHMKLDHLLS